MFTLFSEASEPSFCYPIYSYQVGKCSFAATQRRGHRICFLSTGTSDSEPKAVSSLALDDKLVQGLASSPPKSQIDTLGFAGHIWSLLHIFPLFKQFYKVKTGLCLQDI